MHQNVSVIDTLPLERFKEYKALRIEAIKQDPIAFSDTLEEVLQYPDERWQNDLKENGKKLKGIVFAEINGKLVGMGQYVFQENKNFAHNAYLRKLFVSKEQRGRGIGELLVRRRIEILQNRGIKNIFCEIIETQTGSIELHKKLGFEIVGTLKNFTRIEDTFYSEFVMQKSV